MSEAFPIDRSIFCPKCPALADYDAAARLYDNDPRNTQARIAFEEAECVLVFCDALGYPDACTNPVFDAATGQLICPTLQSIANANIGGRPGMPSNNAE